MSQVLICSKPSIRWWSFVSWPAGFQLRSSTPTSRTRCWTWRCTPCWWRWWWWRWWQIPWPWLWEVVRGHSCSFLWALHLNNPSPKMLVMMNLMMMEKDVDNDDNDNDNDDLLTFKPLLLLQSFKSWISLLQLFSQSSIWSWPQWLGGAFKKLRPNPQQGLGLGVNSPNIW